MQVQLLGRGTYGPIVPVGGSPLWQFKKKPPAQNSVIIYTDGTVKEQATFVNRDIQAANVHTFILGGTDYRCEEGSFEYNALLAAGYTFRLAPAADTYSDGYDKTY